MDRNGLLHALDELLKARFPEDIKEVVLYVPPSETVEEMEKIFRVLLILKHKSGWKLERELSDVLYELELKYDIFIDEQIIGEAELTSLRGKQSFILTALQKGTRV